MAQIIEKTRDVGIPRLNSGALTSGQTVDAGMLCMFDAAGLVRQLNDTVNCKFAGIAQNSAGDTYEPEEVDLDYGTPFFFPKETAAQTDVGLAVFASALGEINTSSSNAVLVGQIIDCEVGIGWWIDPLVPGPVTVTSPFTQDGTDVRPTTAGSAIQTDNPATAAAALNFDDNKIGAEGTGADINVVITPKGGGAISVEDLADYEDNVTGDDDIPNKKFCDDHFVPYAAWNQATTGSDGTAGEVAVTGLTATGKVICTGAEAGTDVAYVVAGTNKFTVYDASDAVIPGKKVNYIVLSLT